ncbi:AraC family transcriptional regulator [Sphingobacterium sp. JUb56]|uniref:helix-turn-helix domain-containing protein n=1 Tax=Sphingobacterium sp. JUb56 TaxID=2587145 RepID=UPI00161DB8C2|nr:AraC family transcriptional regulator [Sphingobacterium sp. JUb56]MBB2950612.1 YesN/AraC family two-component response regulator [Sphingobacterium sp. JUb56]
MKLFIQNMVSLRCKMMVKSELEKLGIEFSQIDLGEVKLVKPISKTLQNSLKEALHLSGLELMDDKKALLIEKIVNIIIETIHYADELPNVNFSDFISEKLQHNYHYLAELFSKTKGITIEHFIILHKVEKIKELIIYNELNLTEISYKMHYCSVSHLSKQFKKVTGLTPTFFKNLPNRQRRNLEDL